jgi:hypothetical protein
MHEKHLAVILSAARRRGLSAVARVLGINRATLASVLVDSARAGSVAAVRQAYIANASALEAM